MGRNFEMARRSAKSYEASGNAYASSSGSDSDESNASLLERSCLLHNKFMLPKDFCDNSGIFDEFFSSELWDTLPNATQQKLAKLLPVAKEDTLEATTLVHSLLSHKLLRFGKEPMDDFRAKLSNGCFRFDVAKLQHSLAELTTKDKRMVELQRMSRFAQNVMLSREAFLFSELHSNDARTLPTAGRITDSYDRRRHWNYDCTVNSAMAKSQAVAKKRYLSEIINVCEEVGLSLTLSDEEDCIHALPTGAVRKQRRMVSAGSQAGEQSNIQAAGVTGTSNVPTKKSGIIGSSNGAAGNSFDGTIFNAPKLFVVTEEHYRKLLLQHRKRKMEEPDHPELNLDNIKLKDVVSRTQIAAGYRRILPLPKVYISDSVKEHTAGMKGRVKSQKSFKTHRASQDQTDTKLLLLDSNGGEQNIERVKVKTEPTGALNVVLKEETPANEYVDANLPENVVPGTVTNNQHYTSTEEECTISSSREPSKECKRSSNTMEENVSEAGETSVTKTTVCTAQSTKPSSNASLHDASASLDSSDSSAVEQGSMNCLFSNGGLHACFLSVVRDLFCSNPDHRSTLLELQLKLDAWTKSSIAERNVWFEQFQNNGQWNETLQSAVQFLAGEFPNQPEDFVPYIEHKVAINILQWIGASRDADSRLVPLCAYWQNRKQEMNKLSGMHSLAANYASYANNSLLNETGGVQATASPKSRRRSAAGSKHLPFSPSYSSSSSMSSVSSLPVAGDNLIALFNDSTTSSQSAKTATVFEDEGSIGHERSATTPPPLCPTEWSVRKATDEETESFREQEKRRYENPHMAFTYKQHSYDSVVGPVKGIYTQAPGISKARGHNMLVANRPNFVTILTLVRDATARLPNGEGTRADICELLKSSQYISPTATDQILQTIVSGALDRMHTERDPCVKYDAKRKIWIYLHRNRTEQEFERLHMQYQGFTKHKKSTVRKAQRHSKDNVSTSSTAKHDLLNESGSSADNFISSNSAVELDLDSSATTGSTTVDPVINIAPPISIAEAATTSIASVTGVKSTTSLLKKQKTAPSASDSIAALQSCADSKTGSNSSTSTAKATTTDVSSVGKVDQNKIGTIKEHQTPVSPACGTDVTYKAASKLCNAVTLISTSGSNVRTIQIPKASLTLASTPATSNAVGVECSTADDALSQDSLLNANPKSPKKLLVSAIVSSSAATMSPSPGANAKQSVVDISRISSPKPILVQSVAASAVSSHTPPAGSFVATAKDGIKIGSSVGGTIVSIRQVKNSSNANICNVAPKSQIVAGGQTASLLNPQTKATQLSLNTTPFASSSGASTIQTMKGGGTLITATIGKPIYSSSIGPSALKQSTNASSIIQTNLSAAVFSQKMVVNSAKANAPQSAGEGTTAVPTVVAIKSASTANITPATSIATSRIVKPATNLFSTITLAKGQQSVLTPAKQRQIIQNLLSESQKNSLANNQIVSHATVIAANAPTVAKQPGQAGDTKQQYRAPGPAYLLENPTTVPAFKINQSANSNIRTLSPKIVKITPTRSKPPTAIRPAGINVSTASVMSPTAAAAAASSVKMIKMNPSTTILTTSESHGTLSTGTAVGVGVSSTAATVTPSAVKNATMRVLKTASGATTVIKAEATRGPSVQQLAQSNTTLSSSAHIGSKMLVNSGINSGQLIPLESLLQKPGIAGTANNAAGGGGGGVNTILKLAGTTKTGQQFLQFGTAGNAASSVAAKSITTGSSTVGSIGHQYTVLPQTRNIISVASTASGNRATTNLPLTIVSSSKAGEAFQPGGSIIVASKKGNLSEINPTNADSASASLLSHISSSPTAKLVQQGTKVKLLTTTTHNANAFGAGPTVSVSQQQSSVFSPKTSLSSTVNVSGEFLNAKIIGVHNIGSGKVKGASSLSLMNANGLNIAHIGGKPVIIANNSSLGANQAITVSTAHLGSNSGTTKSSSPSSPIVFTTNSTANSHGLGQPNAGNVQNTSAAATSSGREIARTNVVSGISGQIQTVLLRNNLLKVQTAPSTSVSKLSHQASVATGSVSSSGGMAGGINAAAGTTLIATTGGRGTTAQSKAPLQQQQTISAAGGTAVILTPNIPTSSITIGGTVVEPSAELANNSDAVSQRTQSPRVLISQPIIIPTDMQKSATSINLKRLKVIPISKPPANK